MPREETKLDLPRVDREVGEHEYRCTRLLLGDWIELEVLVMRVLGAQVLDLDEKSIASYAPTAIQSANKRDHEALFELMGRALQVRSGQGGWALLTRAKQERWWASNIRELGPVLGLFFEVQFSDFFKGLEGLSPLAPKQPDDLDGQVSLDPSGHPLD